MAINVTITDTEGSDELENRVKHLEEAVTAISAAIDLLMKNHVMQKAASGEIDDLEPCDCGDPGCVKQLAYEAFEEGKKERDRDRQQDYAQGQYL